MNALEPALARRGVERPVGRARHPHPRRPSTTRRSTRPTKPIGRYLPAEEAERPDRARPAVRGPRRAGLAAGRGVAGAARDPRRRRGRDAGRRRATSWSPTVAEASRSSARPTAALRGVEAVIDKDLGAALLGRRARRRPAGDRHRRRPRDARLRHRPTRGRSTTSTSPTMRALRRAGAVRERLDGPEGRGGLPVRRAVRASPASSPAWTTSSPGSAATSGTIVLPDRGPDRSPSTASRPDAVRPAEEIPACRAHRGPQGSDQARLRRQRAGRADRRRGDRGRPGDRGDRQDRGQRRRQRLHPDHRRPGVPRGAGRARAPGPPRRSSRSRSSGPAAPTA